MSLSQYFPPTAPRSLLLGEELRAVGKWSRNSYRGGSPRGMQRCASVPRLANKGKALGGSCSSHSCSIGNCSSVRPITGGAGGKERKYLQAKSRAEIVTSINAKPRTRRSWAPPSSTLSQTLKSAENSQAGWRCAPTGVNKGVALGQRARPQQVILRQSPASSGTVVKDLRQILPDDAPARAAMLKALEGGHVGTCVQVLQHLSAEGVYSLDKPLACQLVDKCVESKAWPVVMNSLLPCPVFPMDTGMCSYILEGCLRARRWRPALALVRSSMPSRGLQPTREAYEGALMVCGRCQEAGEVLRLLEEMHARRLLETGSAKDMRDLAVKAAAAGAWEAGLIVCQEYLRTVPGGTVGKGERFLPGMRQRGRTPAPEVPRWSASVVELEAEMVEATILACQRDLREAHRMNEHALLSRMCTRLWELVQEMQRRRGLELGRRAWDSLVHVCSKAGNTQLISQMMDAVAVDERIDSGHWAQRHAALRRCWVDRDWARARALLGSFLASCGRESPPESDELVTMVLDCGLRGDLEQEALAVFNAWWDADPSFSPSSRCRVKAVRTALKLARVSSAFPSLSVTPPRDSNSLDSLRIQVGATEEARIGSSGLQGLADLLDRFERRAPSQRAIVCNMVMEHARVHRLVEEGFAFLEAMRALDIPRQSATLQPLLKLCSSANRQRDVVRLVGEMVEKDKLKPQAQTYSQVIEAATRADMVEEALKLFQTMIAEGFPAGDKECTDLMAALARNGDWSRALDLLQDIRVYTKRPPACIVYTAAVNACGNGGAWEMALMLMRRMEEEGIAPNSYTYSSAIKACSRAGKWEQASALFTEMQERGLPQNEVTYTVILNAHAKAGRLQEAAACLEGMKKRGLSPSTPHYTAAIDACSRSGEYQQALRWFEEMKNEKVPINRMTYSATIAVCGKGGAWEQAVRVLLDMMLTSRDGSSHVCYMLAVDACRRSDQWPVAAYLWDLIELVDPKELNQPTLNSLICAMEHPALHSLVASFYQQAYDKGQVNHWSVAFYRVVDLHNFSRPLAKAALHHVLECMLEKHGPGVARDLSIVSDGEEMGTKEEKGFRSTAPFQSLSGEIPCDPAISTQADKKWSASEMYLPWPRNKARHGYVQDPRDPLVIVTGHGRRRAAGTSVLRDDIADFLTSEFDPPLTTKTMPYNPGRLLVPSSTLLTYLLAKSGS